MSGGPPYIKGGSPPTPYGNVLFWVAGPGRAVTGKPPAGAAPARDLAIGEQTVKTHVRSILTKLGLQDRVQAAIFALRHQPGSHQHQP